MIVAGVEGFSGARSNLVPVNFAALPWNTNWLPVATTSAA
jgi:hypothetical protein